jgi:GT2 family glycosyltransferase
MSNKSKQPITLVTLATYNLKEYWQKLLNTVTSKDPFYLLLIDNGSTDGTGAIFKILAKEYNVLSLIIPLNAGVSTAWNEAMELAFKKLDCQNVIVLNNDSLLLMGTIDQIIKDLKTPGVGIATAKDVSGSYVDEGRFFRALTTSVPDLHETPDFSCFGINKECWKKVGLFDEAFYPAYFEDNDYHYRMKLENIKAVCNYSNYYWHYGSRTKMQSKEFAEYLKKRYVLNRDYYTKKWGGEPGKEKFKIAFEGKKLPDMNIETFKL